jgi:hypothetical protein
MIQMLHLIMALFTFMFNMDCSVALMVFPCTSTTKQDHTINSLHKSTKYACLTSLKETQGLPTQFVF